MSNFNEFLTKIKTAVYGKDVRAAIHDALSYLHKNMSGVYTLPAASASELGGIKIGDGLSIDDKSKLNLDYNKVVRTSGYSDSDILDFLHVDINKNIVPVPLLGDLFKLGTDDSGNLIGLEFSTKGRVWLMTFINEIINMKGVFDTIQPDIELDELTSASSAYYRLSIMDNPALFDAFGGKADGAFVSAHCVEDAQCMKYVQVAVPVVSLGKDSIIPCVATRSKIHSGKWSTWNTSGTGAGGESYKRLIDSYKIYIENNNQMIEATEPPESESGLNGALFSGQLIQSLIRQAISGLNLGETGTGLSFKGGYDGLEGSHYYPGDIVYDRSTNGMGVFLCCTEVQDGNTQLPVSVTSPFSTNTEGDIVWIRLNYMSVPLPHNIDSVDLDNKLIRLKKGAFNQITTEIVSPSIFTKTNIALQESGWQMNNSPYADYPYSYKIRWDEIVSGCSVAVFSVSDDIFRIGGFFAVTSDATEKYVLIYSKRAIDVTINMLIATTGGES